MHVPAATEHLRERATAELAARLPEHVGRLAWDRARLAAYQRDRLRELLAHAAANSRFHARRLAGIDLGRFEIADLPTLPVMTKAEMMSQFDAVVTDRRLSLQRVEAHLEASKTQASLLLDEFVCLASGGSSGLRGVFVQTVGAYTDFIASFISPGVARDAGRNTRPGGFVAAVVAAGSPIHSSALAVSVMSGPVRLVPVPATLPLGEITERLNALAPPLLMGYPTMLALLAAEQRAGRLRIAPAAVTTSSEQLTDQDRAAITAAFGVPVTDQFASTEGLAGSSDPGGRVLTFATDTCIAELVDADNKPVPPGTAADKVLVTNLHNHTQPLIRYELTDRFVRHPDDPAGRLRAAVDGRADSVFRYGDVAVHPITFYSVLVGVEAITEFQVRQTQQGVVIDVVAGGHLDKPAVLDDIRHGLARSGLIAPEVTVRAVVSIERHPETGKVLRFVPFQAPPSDDRMLER
jgi:phenylacetate-coenzyme A ligase PaaK-like adenylate-forming protein